MPKYVNPSESSIYKLNDRLLKWNKFITSFLCRRTNCLDALTSLLMLHEGMLSFRRKQRYFSALDNLWLSEKRAKGQRRIISELCFGRTKTNKSGVIACIRETMATFMTTSETVNLRGYLFPFISLQSTRRLIDSMHHCFSQSYCSMITQIWVLTVTWCRIESEYRPITFE